MAWAAYPHSAAPTEDSALDSYTPPFAIQLVQQVNYGPLESKRYFVPVEGSEAEFVEIREQDLIQANFQKLNACVYCLLSLSPCLSLNTNIAQIQKLQV